MKKKKIINLNNLYIIIDFDHTITSKESNSSWSVLDSKMVLSEEGIKECEKYKNHYLPIEKDIDIPFDKKNKMMKEWYTNHLEIFIKHKLDEKTLNLITKDKNCMELRKDADKFLKFTYEHNIPVIIISAGITNVIENFLNANHCLYDNIYIVSNIIKFKGGIIKGFRNSIIHSLNKTKINIPPKIETIVKNKTNVILLGDNVEDSLIAPKEKNVTKIAFTDKKEEYKKYFDLVYDEDASFEEIIKLIKDID